MSTDPRWKDRRIVQWGLAYLGGAWLVAQVLDTFADPWNVPAGVQRAVGVLLAMGFVATLVVAWFHGEKGRQRVSGTELLVLGALLAATGYLVSLVAKPTGAGAPSASAGRPGTVAVLPFVDLSPDRDHQYFGDGVAEEIISALTRDGRIRVAARTSTFALRDRPIAEIGAALSVATVLEGSVRPDGDSVRITAKLVSVDDGFAIWSTEVDRSIESVLRVQAEISAAVLAELTGTAAPAGPAVLIDPVAYDRYLQGRFYWNRRTEADLVRAVDLFESALDRAPDYARALSGLADAYAVLGFYEYLAADQAFPRARDLARRAYDLDPGLADALATTAYVRLYHEWDWRGAERAFEEAIALNPQYPVAHQWYGNLLVVLGRYDEALTELRTASELDPLSMIARAALAWAYSYAGDHERALETFRQVLELQEDFMLAHYWRASALLRTGDVDGSLAAYERAVTLSDSSAITLAGLAEGLARSGRTDEAAALVARILERASETNLPPYEIGKVYLALGRSDEAFRWFERAHAERAPQLVFIGVDPDLAPLASDARYVRLVRRLDLPRER